MLCLKCNFPLLVIFLVFGWPAQKGEAQSKVPKIVGTWKLNVAKSKFAAGPPLKSRIQKWDWDGEYLSHNSQTVNADGSRTLAHFTAKFDGQDYPVFANGDDEKPARYVRLKWIDAYHFEANLLSKAGEGNRPSEHAVSKDGKILAITQKNPGGTDVFVYNRQ